MAKSTNEIDLLRACINGKTTAFEEVVQKYQSFICAITFSATCDVEKSEELAQETFIKAWKNLSQLKDMTKFRAWLCSIARSIIRNYFRRDRYDIVSHAKSIEKMEDIPSEDFSPVETIIDKERQAVIRQALEQIPEKYREPLVLFYRQDRSIKQVAEQLKLSAVAAETRISRGRKMLKGQVAAMVETTISRMGPSKTFTAAVIASVAGLALKGSGFAVAAGIGTTVSSSGTSTGVAAIMSSVTAKIMTAAAVAAIGVGAVVTYKHVTKPRPGPDVLQTEAIVREIEEEQDKTTEEITEQPSSEMATMLAIDETKDILEVEKSTVMPTQPSSIKYSKSKFVPKGVLSGLITDAKTGKPIEDAIVRVYETWDSKAISDANGFYYFNTLKEAGLVQPANIKLRITAEQYVGITEFDSLPIISLNQDSNVVKHFKLVPACIIELLVIDANDEPIPDAQIWATRDEEKFTSHLIYHPQKTDQTGMVTFDVLEPSENKYLFTATHPNYAPSKLFIKLNDANIIEYGEIVMSQGIDAKGYATYADYMPAYGYYIYARPDWSQGMYGQFTNYPIDPNGYFLLKHIDPGTNTLHVDSGGRQVSLAKQIVRDTRVYNVGQFNLPVNEDELIRVKIPKNSPSLEASISGTVHFIGFEKQPYASVYAFSREGRSGSTDIINGENTFEISGLQPGTYTLQFMGEYIQQKLVTNIKAPSSNIEVELVKAEKPMMQCQVFAADTNEPLKKFKIRVRKLQTLRGPLYLQERKWSQYTTSDGRFEFQTVGPGVYQVQAVAEGYAPLWSDEINTDVSKLAIIKLSKGGTIKGKVVNEYGEMISSAKVIPFSVASGLTEKTLEMFVGEEGAVVTKNGEFILQNIPAGLEKIKIDHPQYVSKIIPDIHVSEGQTTEVIEVVLSKGGVIQGYVYDADGKPSANTKMYFKSVESCDVWDEKAFTLAEVTTDSNGYYHTEGLPERLCYISLEDPYRRLGVVRQTILPTKQSTVKLDFGGDNVVFGRLVMDDWPSEATRVRISSPVSQYDLSFVCNALTRDDGSFIFNGIPFGMWAIYFQEPGTSNKWLKLTSFEVMDNEVSLGEINIEKTLLLIHVDSESPNTSEAPLVGDIK